ncbi:TetR/AcrR family transcriptional regulator [Fodinicola feengrottensis]|uniref:TetR/AcrR family transcriptional regulator n=1 Tax=Fodinicola feengrottensis TaxID=435914 RepID=UPI0013D67018|nr:TetR/AcrR family transcriptional regulator [Fodinicola feengrottensis]
MARETRREDRELRRNILDATTRLLGRCKFADLTVADILAEAGISRGSFYFYFQGKHEVLAELVRQAIDQGHKNVGQLAGAPGRIGSPCRDPAVDRGRRPAVERAGGGVARHRRALARRPRAGGALARPDGQFREDHRRAH